MLDLISAPSVLLPPLIGVTMALAAWASRQFVELGAFAGLTGCVVGLGSLGTRWLTRHDEITRKVFERMQTETLDSRDQKFDDLAALLATDEDPRTGEALDQLKVLQRSLDDIRRNDTHNSVDASDLIRSSQNLIGHCLTSLERSFQLWRTAQAMLTKRARRELIDKREILVHEITESIARIAGAVDGIRTLGIEDNPGEKLASIRTELDTNLELARRVDKRMQSLEKELETLTHNPE